MTNCCICFEPCVPGIACVQCIEGKCCWPCSLKLAEEGALGRCPVCRTLGWRGAGVDARYGGTEYEVHPSETLIELQPVALQAEVVEERYETDIQEDSLCLYLTYWIVGCHGCKLSRAMAAFMATWFRGLSIALVATGSLRRALDSGTLWILLAGELLTFIVAWVDYAC